MALSDVFPQRDIVVTIPKSKLAEVEAEEAEVEQKLAAGEWHPGYYWAMGRMPKQLPRRIYFCWDGAVRAYHEVKGWSAASIFMKAEIHKIEPVPMKSFRGYRYFKEKSK